MTAKKLKVEGLDEGAQPKAAEETPAAPPPDEVAGDAGAPATEPDGPDLDDLVPGLDEAIAKARAGEAQAEAEPDPEAGTEPDPVAEMRARIEALEAEVAAQRDRALRALAEAENVRRRAERDRRDAEAYGGTRLARDLLAVHDNLSRALAAADDEMREQHGAFLEGVELTQRELLKAFGKHKITKIEPERGEKFDPNRHQAMFEAPVPGAPNGTIIEVMEAGFMIADRLLRPAMVGVARGGEQAAPETAEKADEAPAAEEAAATADGPDEGARD